jgi:HD superfamily phosphohydrolase
MLATRYATRMANVVVRDPIHGDVELTREEIALVDTLEVQRLRGIKQLGTAHLVYPGATHTRFEHSIGTLWLTERLLAAMARGAERDADCLPPDADARRVVRIAALLHDVTHLPFGHNIEDQTGLLPRHDRPERFRALLGGGEVGDVLARLGLRDTVLSMLAGDGDDVPPWWRQLLSDTIDADLLDYLRRDAYYTGLALRYDDRILAPFRIDRASGRMFVDCEKQGMLREDALSEVLRTLETRYHFSERVYYHHAKIAAGALIARMVEIALRAGALTPADLQVASDQSLIDRFATLDLGDERANARLRRFHARLVRRALPKRVLVLPLYLNRAVQNELLERYFTPGRPEPRFAWEEALEREAGARFGRELDVILYCPKRSMQLKEARTLVRLPGLGARIRPLAEFAGELPRLADVEESYLRLWKLYVFTSEPDVDVRRKLQEMCLQALPAGCVNALRL